MALYPSVRPNTGGMEFDGQILSSSELLTALKPQFSERLLGVFSGYSGLLPPSLLRKVHSAALSKFQNSHSCYLHKDEYIYVQ